MKPTLVIFARAPRLGGVKRRLAAEIGQRSALRFHRTTTESLIRRLGRDPRWRTVLAVTPQPWRWPVFVPCIAQEGRDLGERMAKAIEAAPHGPAILVGSDIPGIKADIVARAFHALGAVDVVFGPARDGGYWLIGVRNRQLLHHLFGDVRWGSEHALADTVANIPAGRRHALVDMLEDVDDAKAWRRRREEVIRP